MRLHRTQMHGGMKSRWLPLAIAAVVALVGACDPALQEPPTSAATNAPSPATSPTPSFVRPTPTPQPTFLIYTVARGDTLSSIADAFGTSAQSLAYWNRASHPSLDPESSRYDPDTIQVGWTLILIPFNEVDPEDLPPPAAMPTPIASRSPSA
jgi:LysM domain